MELKGVVGASAQRWVGIEERPPEEGKDILCVGAKGGYFIANKNREYNVEDGKIWINGQGWRVLTHWMVLPELPREVDHES